MPLRTQSDGSTFEVETSSRREVRLSPKLRLSTGGGGGSDAAAAFAAVAAAVAGAVTLAAALVPPGWTSARAAGRAAARGERWLKCLLFRWLRPTATASAKHSLFS